MVAAPGGSSAVLSEIQGDWNVTAERMAKSKDRYKMEDKCHAFLLLLDTSWAQEGVIAFQQKQFEHLLQYYSSW
jgi:hypothetical protein